MTSTPSALPPPPRAVSRTGPRRFSILKALNDALRTPCAVMRPNTEPNGRFPPSCPSMYEPEGPFDSSKMSDSAQYENTLKGGVPSVDRSASSFTALRMNPAFHWLSMLTTTSLVPPPWPAYDEFH